MVIALRLMGEARRGYTPRGREIAARQTAAPTKQLESTFSKIYTFLISNA
jgi:hypothetical protein